MLAVNLYDDKYLVRFKYTRGDPLYHERTTCTIRKVADDPDLSELVGFGHTKLHPNDNFCKNTGRKISFARALKDADMDKEERKLFWQEYFKARGKVN